MPSIKRIAEKIANRQSPADTVIGVFKKGEAKDTKKGGFPGDLDYFRYAPKQGHEATADHIYDLLGERPDRIKIYLPYPGMIENFNSGYQHGIEFSGNYRQMSLCDGESCLKFRTKPQDRMSSENPPACQMSGREPWERCPKGCELFGIIKAKLVGFNYPGIIEFQTGSYFDLLNLYDSFDEIDRLLKELNGNQPYDLREVPLWISRNWENREVQKRVGRGKDMRVVEGETETKKYSLLRLSIDPDFYALAQMIIEQQKQEKLMGSLQRLGIAGSDRLPESYRQLAPAQPQQQTVTVAALQPSVEPLEISFEDTQIGGIFCNKMGLATTVEQLDKMMNWIQLENQWSRIEGIPGVQDEIQRLYQNNLKRLGISDTQEASVVLDSESEIEGSDPTVNVSQVITDTQGDQVLF